MADYYTKFSVEMVLPSAEVLAYAINLAGTARKTQLGDEAPADFPPALAEVIEDWQFEADDSNAKGAHGEHGLWLHSEYGGIDAACAFIQHLMVKFKMDGAVTLEWSNDCSKPRLDAFGGGAALITATEIKTFSTGEWLRQQVEWLDQKQKLSYPDY